MRSEVRAVVEMGLREYGRTPVLLALLAVLPGYMIGLFALIVPAAPIRIAVPVQGTIAVPMTAAVAVTMAPLVAGLIGGLAGLFLLESARRVDGRLAIAGMDRGAILLGRGAVLGVAALLASVVSMAVIALVHVPRRPGWFLLALVLVGLCYGAIGGVVGLVANRLAGVYVVMFAPMIDLFLAQSPFATERPAIAPYLPGHYPMRLAVDAAFTPRVALDHAALGAAYLAVVALVAALAVARSTAG